MRRRKPRLRTERARSRRENDDAPAVIEGAWQIDRLSRADRVIRFIENLAMTKGVKHGQKFRLLPDQRRFIKAIYGRQRVRLGVLSQARGNGKTGLVAALCLAHLLGPEAEPRGEIYSAGIDRKQAGLVFAEMAAIIDATPEFRQRVNVVGWKKMIEVIEGVGVGSTYEALSADARRAHGLAPSLWIYDELAQAKDRELLNSLETAMGKRRQHARPDYFDTSQ